MMYCSICYREDGKGTVEAIYVFNGKSLCNIHFWKEAERMDTLSMDNPL